MEDRARNFRLRIANKNERKGRRATSYVRACIRLSAFEMEDCELMRPTRRPQSRSTLSRSAIRSIRDLRSSIAGDRDVFPRAASRARLLQDSRGSAHRASDEILGTGTGAPFCSQPLSSRLSLHGNDRVPARRASRPRNSDSSRRAE